MTEDKKTNENHYLNGWDDAFDAISNYVEAEICIITASMIRRMKHEEWRQMIPKPCPPEPSSDLPLEES